MSSTPPPQSSSSQNTNYTNHMIDSIFSYKGNIMLAAIISLLLVILFVLLLHVYAKWFLERSRNRRRRRTARRISSLILSDVPSHTDVNTARHSDAFTFDTTGSKGVDPSVIALIPTFIYEASAYENELECVICLSSFEQGEAGRSLPKCCHAFHVDCIDTWLVSHTNCPICRMPVSCEKQVEENVICLEDQVVNNQASELPETVPSEVGSGDRDNNSLEIIAVDHAQECADENASAGGNGDSISSPSSSTAGSSLGCSCSYSLKRMLSKSRSERKVYLNFSEVEA